MKKDAVATMDERGSRGATLQVTLIVVIPTPFLL